MEPVPVLRSEGDIGNRKKGINLTLEGANIILQRHLNKSCISMEYLNRGYNNGTYIAKSHYGVSYIIRVSGRGGYCKKMKTEGEVAGIFYLSQKCPEIPVPRILGFCSSQELSGINGEYILMEKLPGTPLDDIWLTMDMNQKFHIAQQVAKIFIRMKSLKFDELGSFVLSPRISASHGMGVKMDDLTLEDIRVGECMELKIGPFTEYLSYYRDQCGREIEELQKCSFLQPQLRNLERIENFVSHMTDREKTRLDTEVYENVFFTFTHGDIEARNILVENNEVTGIVDFEFCGSFPIDADWFDGMGFLGARTAEWQIFNEIPVVDDDDTPEPTIIAPVREVCLAEIKKTESSVLPEKIPGHFERAILYYFACNICPWYLREVEEPPTPTQLTERSDAIRRLEFVLDKYGF